MSNDTGISVSQNLMPKNSPEQGNLAQLALAKQKDNNQFEYAKLSLNAQEKAHMRECELSRDTQKYSFLFSVIFVISVVGTGITALILNKEAFLLEAFKLLVAFLGGGGVGYAIRSRKKQSPEQSLK